MDSAHESRKAAVKKSASFKTRSASDNTSAKKPTSAVKATTGQHSRSQIRSARPLTKKAQKSLARLLYHSYAERGTREVAVSGVVVLRPNEDLSFDSTEMQMVTALDADNISAMVAAAQGANNISAMVAAVQGGMGVAGAAAAVASVDNVKVVRRLGNAMALERQRVGDLGNPAQLPGFEDRAGCTVASPVRTCAG